MRETLEVLAEHLGGGRAGDLAAQLPPEIAHYLSHEQGGAGKAFALSEFVDEVYQRGDALHPEEATVRAQAVLQTVEEAVSEGGAGGKMPARHCRKSSPRYSGRRGRPNRASRDPEGDR